MIRIRNSRSSGSSGTTGSTEGYTGELRGLQEITIASVENGLIKTIISPDTTILSDLMELVVSDIGDAVVGIL